MAGGSVASVLRTRFPQGLDESSIATIGREVLRALEYVHTQVWDRVLQGHLCTDECRAKWEPVWLRRPCVHAKPDLFHMMVC